MADDLVSAFQNPQPQKQAQPVSTVCMVGDEKDANKFRIYFGAGKDDYFNAVGSFESVQSLMGTMECAVKSPRMVEGFRAFPPEKRPTLRQAETGNAAAYYSPVRNEIVMGRMVGCGFESAGTFAHEYHHFKQRQVGDWVNVASNVPDQILAERMGEAAAEVANFQYMNDVKHLPEARADFEKTMKCRPGCREYVAAKEAGKSESDCVFASMQGYAGNFQTALFYIEQYHKPLMDLNDKNRELLKHNPAEHNVFENAAIGSKLESLIPKGKNIDEVAYFKATTVGLMKELPSAERIKQEMRSPTFDYIPAIAYVLIKDAQKQCAACGMMDPDFQIEGRAVRGVQGTFADGAAFERSLMPPPMPTNGKVVPPPINGVHMPFAPAGAVPPVQTNGNAVPPPINGVHMPFAPAGAVPPVQTNGKVVPPPINGVHMPFAPAGAVPPVQTNGKVVPPPINGVHMPFAPAGAVPPVQTNGNAVPPPPPPMPTNGKVVPPPINGVHMPFAPAGAVPPVQTNGNAVPPPPPPAQSLQGKLNQMSHKPNLMQTLQSKTVQKDAAPKIPAKQAVRQGESR